MYVIFAELIRVIGNFSTVCFLQVLQVFVILEPQILHIVQLHNQQVFWPKALVYCNILCASGGLPSRLQESYRLHTASDEVDNESKRNSSRHQANEVPWVFSSHFVPHATLTEAIERTSQRKLMQCGLHWSKGCSGTNSGQCELTRSVQFLSCMLPHSIQEFGHSRLSRQIEDLDIFIDLTDRMLENELCAYLTWANISCILLWTFTFSLLQIHLEA